MSVSNALAVQGRVVWALMLREIHTIHGQSRLGYLWVLVNSCFGLAVFWGMRHMMKMRAPHGMNILAYLVAGMITWQIFNSIVSKCMVAEKGNRALLTFPQTTVFDVMLARSLVILATDVLVAILLLAIGQVVGYNLQKPEWTGIFCVMFLLLTFSMGLGMILAALNTFLPVLEKLTPMALRILFFVSGVFFDPKVFVPYAWRDIFWLNPVLQMVEWLRASLAPTYAGTPVSPFYLFSVSLTFLTVGMILERYVRKYAGQDI